MLTCAPVSNFKLVIIPLIVIGTVHAQCETGVFSIASTKNSSSVCVSEFAAPSASARFTPRTVSLHIRTKWWRIWQWLQILLNAGHAFGLWEKPHFGQLFKFLDLVPDSHFGLHFGEVPLPLACCQSCEQKLQFLALPCLSPLPVCLPPQLTWLSWEFSPACSSLALGITALAQTGLLPRRWLDILVVCPLLVKSYISLPEFEVLYHTSQSTVLLLTDM